MQHELPFPLVSIALCTYNGESYLPAQLDSIFQQTYPNTEVIAIDDCSTDGTVNILYQYAAQHKNLQIIQNTTNLGYIKNFEKVMALCKGDFIAPCDQDDVWENNKIALMVNNIGQYNMAYCNSELVDAHLNSLHQKMSDIKNLNSYNNCLVFSTDNCIAGHAALITRHLYEWAKPFPDCIPHDHWLAYIATLNGGTKYLNMPLVTYRNHSNNVIGAIKTEARPHKGIRSKREKKQKDYTNIRRRIEMFYNKCNIEFLIEKKVLFDLMMSYKSFSLKNNIKRVRIFLKYRNQLLAIKKRSALRKWFFCYKMFFKIK